MLDIKFKKYISPIQFEIVLINYYKQSKKSDKVTFNFEHVKRSGIFELALITIWIKELKKKSIVINVELPTDEIFYKFLDQYRFLDLLNTLQIATNRSLTSKSDSLFLTTPFLPIKFYSENEYEKLLEYLKNIENYKRILEGLELSKVMHPSVFRGIILKELGDNIYRHARGLLPLILMTKSVKKETEFSLFQEKDAEINKFKESYFNCELEYLNYMGWSNIITIVVADKGSGLASSELKKAYKADKILPNKKIRPTEFDLIEYAFMEHSTTSDPKERLGELEDLLNHFNEKGGSDNLLPPVTGLFRLFNIIKKYKGFILIRTGMSILTIDFKDSNEQPKVKTYSKIGKYPLEKFGGTQYKMYFPIVDKHSEHGNYTSKNFSFSETESKIPFHYISLDKIFINEKSSLSQNIKDFDENFIQSHKLKNKDPKSGLIVDFNNLLQMDKKAIYFVLAYLMRSQTSKYIHTIINISQEDLIDLKSFFNKELEGFLPIICFDRAFKRNIIGVDSENEIIYNNLLSSGVINSESVNDFVRKYHHLFIEEDNSIKFIHNRNHIFSIARSNIRKNLSEYILTERNNIYKPNYKVLLPSKLYSQGFFEVYNLFENIIIKSKIQQFIIYSILELKPQVVLTITENLSLLVEHFIKEVTLLDKKIKFKPLKVDNPNEMTMSSFLNLGLNISKNDSILLVTDVIGSSTTIKNIISSISYAEKINILAIVNASEIEEDHFYLNDTSIGISWLAKKKLNFYNTLPRNWSIEEIIYLDRFKLRLVEKEKKVGPIFTENIDLFRYCFIGHFESGEKHYTYLFDVPILLMKYGLKFTNEISNSIQEIEETFTEIKPHVIIYPSFNPGLKIFAEELSIKILSPTIPVSRDELNSYQSNFNKYQNYSAIILDDAFESGTTLMKLIEYANRMDVKNIFIYIIINRGTDPPKKFFENINLYNSKNITMKYIFSINIPSYTLSNCPHCNRINKLKEIKNTLNKYKLDDLDKYIDKMITDFKVINLESMDDIKLNYLRETLTLNPYSLVLRHQIEESKNNILTRTELLRSIFQDKSDHQKIIEFFRQLYLDNQYDILFMDFDTAIFEKELEASITQYCENVLNEMGNISVDEFIWTLTMFSKINPLYLKDKYLKIMRRNINNPEKLFVILINNIYQQSLLKYAKEIRKDCEQIYNNTSLIMNKDIIGEYIRLLKDYETNDEKKINTFSYYNELVTVNHKLNDISQKNLSLRNIEYQDSEKLLEFWKNAEQTFGNIVRNLRGLLTIEIEDFNTHKKIKRLVNKIESLVNNVNATNNIDPIRKTSIIIDSVNQIYDCLTSHPETSLQQIRNDFAPNILNLINYLKQHHLADLKQKEIELKVIQETTTNFNVFCDNESLLIILKNIFENIIIHSQAKNVFIILKKEKNEDTLNTFFIDNGIGLPEDLEDKIKVKKGFKIIQKYAEEYSGNCVMEKYSDKFADKFDNKFDRAKTIISLKLKHIGY